MAQKQIKKKFRNKILLYLMTLTLAPLAVWGILIYRESLQNYTDFFERQLQQAAKVVESQAQSWELSNQSLLRFLVREIATEPQREWSITFKNLLSSRDEVFAVAVTDTKGNPLLLINGLNKKTKINLLDRAYFQKALLGEFNSEPVISKIDQLPLLCSAGPLFKNQVLANIVVVCSFLEKLGPSVGAIHIGATGYALLVDENGRVLAHPDSSLLTESEKFRESVFIKTVLASRGGRLEFQEAGQDYVAFNIRLQNGWRAISVQAKKEILELSRKNLKGPFSIGFALLFLLFILSSFFVDRLTMPLQRLVETVRKFGKGDLKIKAKIESQDEFGLLAMSFNDMAEQIRATIFQLQEKKRLLAEHRDQLHQQVIQQSQKLVYSAKMSSLGEMASGIAHEINNPLAIISLRAQHLQSALGSGKLTIPEAIETSAQIEKTCLRIHKIIRGLKTFSHDGSRDPMIEESLSVILAETEKLCSESLATLGIDLETTCSPEISIECQPVQLSQVILNLIMNSRDAIRNLPERWIRIECQDQGEKILLKFTDSGKGIHEPIRSQMMQPFYTTKEVGAGTGLGLSISKGIIEHHEGRFLYNPDHEWTQFFILLPKRQSRHDADLRMPLNISNLENSISHR